MENLLPVSFDDARQKLSAAVEHVHDHIIPHERNNFHPYALRHRALWLMSALLVTVKVVVVILVSYVPPVPAISSAINSDNIIALTNQSRSASGLSALTANAKLAQAAQAKASDMVARQYFSHVAPDGRNPWDFISAAGYAYQAAGENLAVNFLQAEEVDSAWMNSAGHRANILNATFKEIGIGIATGQYNGNTVTFVVQMFGAPQVVAAAPAKPAPKPAPKPSRAPAPKATKIKQKSVKSESVQAPAPPAPTPPLSPNPAPPAPTSVSPPPVAPVTAPIKLSLRGAESTNQPAPDTAATAVAITDLATEIRDGKFAIAATLTGTIASVTVLNSDQSFVLRQENGKWLVDIAVGELIDGAPIILSIVDKEGKTILQEISTATASVVSSYSPTTELENSSFNLFGLTLNTAQFESTFYSLFVAALLFALMLAIAIRPRVQYLAMVAHTSVVVLLATVLWVSSV